jgi:hypothetical protein
MDHGGEEMRAVNEKQNKIDGKVKKKTSRT